MKYLLFGLIFTAASSSYAVKTCIATIPQDCQVQNTEFLATDRLAWRLAVDCLMSNGQYVKYISTTANSGNILNQGGAYLPEAIYFKRANQFKVTVDCR